MSKNEKRQDEDMLERARAARALVEGLGNRPDTAMAAFISIFHPNLDDKTRRELIESSKKTQAH